MIYNHDNIPDTIRALQACKEHLLTEHFICYALDRVQATAGDDERLIHGCVMAQRVVRISLQGRFVLEAWLRDNNVPDDEWPTRAEWIDKIIADLETER